MSSSVGSERVKDMLSYNSIASRVLVAGIFFSFPNLVGSLRVNFACSFFL